MTKTEYKDELDRPLILPADVLLFPVSELAPHVQKTLDYEEGDFALTRPNTRSYSRIVSQETAVLLEEFRRPMPLVEGVLRYSVRNGLDPYETLETSFPILQMFSAAAFLVPDDSPLAGSVSATCAPGQLYAGYEIRRLIRALEDTEVYQASAPDGEMVALKVVRSKNDMQGLFGIRREAETMRHLNGVCSPRLVEHSVYRDREFIATSWLTGVPIIRRALELRNGKQKGWRQELHQLCCRLLDAYCTLQERGVIHGDVHTHNAFVDRDDSVMLLDFGLARMPDRTDLDHNERSGLAWFMAPELAAAMLHRQPLPRATFKEEQYALAALIYFLICGEQYLTAAPEKEALMRQILDAEPPPFTRHGFEGWPAVEAVLARAMSKKAGDRYTSIAEFRDAFVKAQPPREKQTAAARSIERQPWVENMLAQSEFRPGAYQSLFADSPTASAYFGATGLIWFLYRCAQIRQDAHLLSSADLWARQLLAEIDLPGSFGTPGADFADAHASLYLGRPGLHLVSALVGHARGDIRFCARQAHEYVRSSRADSKDPELLAGRAGTLAGGAMLFDALSWSGRQDTSALASFLSQESRAIEKLLNEQPAVQEQSLLPHLGIAHGWAGVLYALLAVYRSLRLDLPGSILDRLDELAAMAQPDGRGVCWQGTLQHPGLAGQRQGYAPGWCSGSAGHVFLWALAAEMCDDARFSALAEKSAWFAWENDDRGLNLCCGLTGRTFALLRAYRHSGREEWLDRAQVLARLTFSAVSEVQQFDSRPFTIFRGALGPAMLALELERPQSSLMPLFETEGWPRQ